MKWILIVVFFLAGIASSTARAEDYYVELGRTASVAEAQSTWADLQSKQKYLAKYGLFPNQILQADGSATFRVQAGPMVTKEEAQRVCRRLFRRQISCFVIEGFDPNNTKTFDAGTPVSPVGVSDFLPWHQSAPPMVAAAPAVAPEPSKSSQAKVDVAEAIPVPVTESNEVTVGEPVAVSSSESTVQTVPVDVSGWLNVQPFLDEAHAQKFWDDVKQHAHGGMHGLSVQVIHPVVSHDIPKVILSVGTFPSEAAAMQFCHDNIPSSNYLECQFSSQPPQGEDAPKEEAKEARKQFAGNVAAAEDDATLFWVQVLSEKSQDKALEKWERIRTDNDDLLADVRSQITTSLSDPGIYVVRIGPLKTKAKAAKLCDALKAHKVGCTLVTL